MSNAEKKVLYINNKYYLSVYQNGHFPNITSTTTRKFIGSKNQEMFVKKVFGQKISFKKPFDQKRIFW